ncbi:tripartite tricarboxylate transporter family receptor [Variibacter gotjawalensis]|uniref:Tripartite tricarboxylate transporter family receptor n=1 Tax=Variibacter gotjawalensis TaxID=1333996 RepID=A0A0S3PQR7_9BRAD|nr:tripartite tricarboxylate transporter substrate binding protein [Variibacter gotjawalensis]NIK48578.1 tripartite-type tricarboxylate transporter receptor subunit TctC [Variibacter gotjawalensis]RZS50443.1 tripartite-type tricarboxylate transporter receptor subunit TctC [Variibacter gotjawalensis]BAT58277.1 tripartite tricarboxylate transporter family receptor [Variibacter gotjawalensis]
MRKLVIGAAFAIAVTSGGHAYGQDCASRRFIVPYGPGGSGDTTGRLLAQKLGEIYGQNIVVENMPGAGAIVGTQTVARSAPDACTMTIVVPGIFISRALAPQPGFDPLEDLAGVSLVGKLPILLSVSAKVPVQNLKEFVDWAKKNPASYGTNGVASVSHLGGSLFGDLAGFKMTHVPYRTGAAALPDVFSGDVTMSIDSMLIHTLIQGGGARPLAQTGSRRWPTAPDVPTTVEAGFPDLTIGSWFVVLVPSKTPADRQAQLSSALQKVLDMPDVREKLITFGVDPVGGTPKDTDAFIRREVATYTDIVRKAGIKLTAN